MSKLAEFRRAERELQEQLALLEKLKSDARLQDEMAFEEQLKGLMDEYGMNLQQVIDSNSRIRVTIARARPKKRVRGCRCFGMRPTRMAIMMMLSMPRTISRAVRVKKATQISGLVSHSIIGSLRVEESVGGRRDGARF